MTSFRKFNVLPMLYAATLCNEIMFILSFVPFTTMYGNQSPQSDLLI